MAALELSALVKPEIAAVMLKKLGDFNGTNR